MLFAPAYAAVSLVTLLSVILLQFLAFNVGRNRGMHHVPPPQITGPEPFERAFRVQQNTLEQAVPFLASLWLFALYLSPPWAAGLGFAWCIARAWYAICYLKDAKRRMPGFIAAMLVWTLLTLGALFGVVRALFL